MGEILNEDAFFQILCFPLQKCSKNLTVDSKPSVSRRFRKRKKRSYPKGRDKVTLEKKCFILYFFSDKLNYYKANDLRKFVIPDAFKQICWKNAFNWSKVHQFSSPMVDYAWFLVKCMNFLNDTKLCNVYTLGRGETYCKPRDDLTMGWSFKKTWKTWWSYHDHAMNHGRHAVIMAWSWPCFAMLRVWLWQDHGMAAMLFQPGELMDASLGSY